jgi:hypothetical protein
VSAETNSSSSVDEYCAAVRAELADLPAAVRDDLLEDLPDHLAEVLADGEGTLRERLGEPAAYAAELRTAAGLDPVTAESGGVHAGLSHFTQRMAEAARRFDLRAGRLVGFGRLAELRRALRPGWWVLRGWIVTVFISGAGHHDYDRELFPQLNGSHLLGGVALIAIVGASVWLGQRSLTFSVWPRGLMVASSAAVAIWAVSALPGSFGGQSYAYVPASGPADGYPDVTDVYVYDQAGNPVNGARLFDQNGNPIQLGSGYCLDGNPAPGSGNGLDPFTYDNGQPWTYPLCPSDPGPFRSGPGSVPAPSASASSSVPTPSPTGSFSATGAPKVPTATPTR